MHHSEVLHCSICTQSVLNLYSLSSLRLHIEVAHWGCTLRLHIQMIFSLSDNIKEMGFCNVWWVFPWVRRRPWFSCFTFLYVIICSALYRFSFAVIGVLLHFMFVMLLFYQHMLLRKIEKWKTTISVIMFTDDMVYIAKKEGLKYSLNLRIQI